MKTYIRTFINILVVGFLAACAAPIQENSVHVRLSTDMGNILIEVNETAAPETSAYFLDFVDQGAFDDTAIYRVGFLADSPNTPKFIEGGMLSPFVQNSAIRSMADTNLPLLEVLEDTQTTGLKVERGVVFLGRNILGNGEALPDFVIALDHIPEFEHGGQRSPDGKGFPVFAKVVEGMEVVDQIALQARDGQTHFPFLQGQVLTEPIVISIARVTK
ncbi:MAG: peptidylprolyl isomerase [Maricaulaceae bacterium]